MKRLFFLPLLLLGASACNLLQVKVSPDPFYSVVLQKDADNAAALYSQGHRFVEQGRYKEALPYFERLTRQEAGDARAWFSLGRCHYEARQFGKARAAFARANALQPSEATLLALAVATLMEGKVDEARTLAVQSEKTYGVSAALDQIRGDIAFFERQPEQALQFYQQSLAKNPKQPEVQGRVKDLEGFLSRGE